MDSVYRLESMQTDAARSEVRYLECRLRYSGDSGRDRTRGQIRLKEDETRPLSMKEHPELERVKRRIAVQKKMRAK